MSANSKLLGQEKHVQTKMSQIRLLIEEQSDQGLFVGGSAVVECLNRDRRAAGSSLNKVTALSFSKTH